MDNAKRLQTAEELAVALSVPIWKVRTLYRSGKIPHLKLGHRTVRFDFDAVMKALEQETAATR